ncbi:hypothetical protein LTR09_000032 [Extremus antarcticus]|uniref:Uncharacterized protein n=1 Tax=Extremus antarcticus TaxID=702011 RepID=A0AAJ0LWT1_9PEZI|nr:hypothetical protein LTR09_000032 [Extremus antarcticus]
MDSGSVPPPSYQAAPEIPTDIFRPLLAIAQRQYDASEVKGYYQIMLRHLRRMGTMNADAAYTILSPISDKKGPLPGQDDDQVSPKTVAMNDEPAFEPSYEPGQHDQIQIATSSRRSYPVLEEEPRQMDIEVKPALPPRHDSANFCDSPPEDTSMMLPPTSAESAQHRQSAPRTVSLPTHLQQQQSPYQQAWLSPEQYHLSHNMGHQQPRFMTPFPSPAHYHASMNSTPIPFSSPFAPPPQQQHPQQHPQQLPQQHPQQLQQQYQYPQQHQYQQDQQMYNEPEQEGFLGPLGNSLGLSNLANNLADGFYYPIVDVIPSRRGRKALMTKGVRRFTGVM